MESSSMELMGTSLTHFFEVAQTIEKIVMEVLYKTDADSAYNSLILH